MSGRRVDEAGAQSFYRFAQEAKTADQATQNKSKRNAFVCRVYTVILVVLYVASAPRTASQPLHRKTNHRAATDLPDAGRKARPHDRRFRGRCRCGRGRGLLRLPQSLGQVSHRGLLLGQPLCRLLPEAPFCSQLGCTANRIEEVRERHEHV